MKHLLLGIVTVILSAPVAGIAIEELNCQDAFGDYSRTDHASLGPNIVKYTILGKEYKREELDIKTPDKAVEVAKSNDENRYYAVQVEVKRKDGQVMGQPKGKGALTAKPATSYRGWILCHHLKNNVLTFK